ncbi:MAG: hypothetical protein PWP65_1709 [Clostridia bacterium]|nr:hypothetical protein [Clostridia bacterium]
MVTRRLEMIFQNAAGRRTTLAVLDPREDLLEADVRAAMETIIAKNIFTSPGGDLVAIAGARIVVRQTNDVITM